MAKHHRTSSLWPPKSAIVDAVAHLSIGLLESYALNEVSDSERRRLDKHVASCQRCADLLGKQLVWAAQMRSPFRRKVEKMIEEGRKKRAPKG